MAFILQYAENVCLYIVGTIFVELFAKETVKFFKDGQDHRKEEVDS